MPVHDVRVWYRATDALDSTAITAAVSVLSDAERTQYSRFRFAHDARDYAAAHALLRASLSRDGDRAPADWRFERTADGKPFLVDHDAGPISFSLSHSIGMVACAVSTQADVGIDVERTDREVDVATIASRFFAPAEAAELGRLDSGRQRDRFFELWTLKEALAKALGVGMAESLASLAFTVGKDGEIGLDAPGIDTESWRFSLFAPGPHHRLAVAARYRALEVPLMRGFSLRP